MLRKTWALAGEPATAQVSTWSHAPRIDASAQHAARGAGLPPEIAFLSNYDVPIGALVEAAAEARRLRVPPQVALQASGAVSEDRYYALLARRLGMAFTDNLDAYGPAAAEPEAAIAGIARLASGAFVIAPTGHALTALLPEKAGASMPRGRMILTTPRRLSAWVQSSAAEKIADDASENLRRVDPALSAAPGYRGWQGAALAAGLIVATAAYFMSPGLWFAIAQVLTLIMTGGVVLRLAAAFMTTRPTGRKAALLSDANLPVYTLLIPLYRETEIAEKLTRALARLDYPRSKLDIKIIVEHGDHETRAAFEALTMPWHCEIIIAPPGAPRTKPRALNVALRFARGELVTIYDAEDEPEPDQLRLAAARFAEASADVACLQARLAIDNSADSWVASLFAIEYAGLFDVYNPGLSALNLPMPLGGTSNHFRIDALRAIHGWDAWNVTEDADLGLRLARFGYRVEALASTTHEEAPTTIRAWLAQRRRWQKGWAQTLITVTRNPALLCAELGIAKAVVVVMQLASGLLGPTLGFLLFAIVIHDAVFGTLLTPSSIGEALLSFYWCSSFILCIASIIWPALLGIKRRGLRAEAMWLPLLPVYYLAMAIASFGALIELFRNPYHWSKTTHGLARTSRLRPPSLALHAANGNAGWPLVQRQMPTRSVFMPSR
jgi:cellulose synthase/poly-beta-1,6-N-acetylglucosamine synthase-like glycosyltransferase